MPEKHRKLTLFIIILAGETIFFLPFVLARIFRPTLLHVFNIDNAELGSYFAIYGIVATVSYFFGGPLADRFPARKLMAIALWLTSLGGVFMATVPGGKLMMFIYGFWGFTTIFLFWAAMIRATREWGGTEMQGRAFGWLEGGRGATAALIGTLALILFSVNMPADQALLPGTQRLNSFRLVLLGTSLFTFLTGLLVWFFVPVKPATKLRQALSLQSVIHVMKIPAVWCLAMIILCAYSGYKITDDFSLYANEVLGFNEIKSAGVGTAALWMRACVAILAGYLAERYSASKIISLSFLLAILGGAGIVLDFVNTYALLALSNLAILMAGIYSVRALYFVLIHEANFPLAITGTVVGIASVAGYTPDIFMSPWMGYLLDNNPGETGHKLVFLVLCFFSLTGYLATLIFKLLISRGIGEEPLPLS